MRGATTTNTTRSPKRISTSSGAFFNGVPEKGLDGQKGNAVPFLQSAGCAASRDEGRFAEGDRSEGAELDSAETAWEQRQREMPVSDVTSGLTGEYAFDNTLANAFKADAAAKVVKRQIELYRRAAWQGGGSRRRAALSFGDVARFTRKSPFTVALWLRPDGPSGMEVIQRYEKSPKVGPGYEIALDYANKNRCAVIVRLRNAGPDSGIAVKSKAGVGVEEWSHVAISYDGSGRAKGIQIYIDGRNVPINIVQDKLAGDFASGGESQTGNKDWGTAFKGQLGDLRIYNRRLYTSEAMQLGSFNPVHTCLRSPAIAGPKTRRSGCGPTS